MARRWRTCSKKGESHAYAVAFHLMYYNFVCFHAKLRLSPAMAAGVSNRLGDIREIVTLVEATDEKPGRRGSYRAKNETVI